MFMKFSIFSLFISFSLFCNALVYAQQQRVKIGDFVTEHEGFEENEAGEITPINIKEINKIIRFFCGGTIP